MVAGARWAPRAFEISPQVFERSPPIASEIGWFGRDAAMRQRSRHQRFDSRRQVGWLPIHTRTLFRTFQKSWKSAERERCLTKDGATTRCQNWRFGHLYKNSFSLGPFQNDGCEEIIHNCQKYDPDGSFFQKKVHSPSVLSCAKCFHSSDYFLWWKSFRAQLIFVIEVGILFWCFRAQLIKKFFHAFEHSSSTFSSSSWCTILHRQPEMCVQKMQREFPSDFGKYIVDCKIFKYRIHPLNNKKPILNLKITNMRLVWYTF